MTFTADGVTCVPITSVGEVCKLYDELKKIAAVKKGTCPPELLTALISNSARYWRVGDFGFVSLWPMAENEAHVHALFWDRRLRGREQLVRDAMLYAAETFAVKLFWTAVPKDNRVTRAFIKRVGFQTYHENSSFETFCGTPGSFIVKTPEVHHG